MKIDINREAERPLAVVTGASSGIGYELARIFAENGFDLLIAAEDTSIHEAAAVIQNLGVDVEAVQVDLSTYEGVEDLYDRIQMTGRHVDSIALNAGVGVGGEFLETDLDEEFSMIHLNVLSVVHLAKMVLRDMADRGHGRILFTSSIAAEMPGPYYAVYAATKAFVQSFAEAIRNEVHDKGITVTSLQPGPTDTNFFARAHMLNTKAGQGRKDNPAEVAEEGFKALMNDRDGVVAGSMQNMFQVGMARFMTDEQKAAAQADSTKPQ